MNAPSSPGALLREVARLYVRAQRDQASCGDGASTVQCHVLTELARHNDLTLQGLVQRLGLDKAWLSRAVDALVEDGTVVRSPNPEDGRSVYLNLTRHGRARAQKLEQGLNGHAAQLLEAIPEERHAQIQESLHLMLGALQSGGPTEASALVQPSGTRGGGHAACSIRPAKTKDWMAIKRLLTAANLPLDGARDHLDQFLVGSLDAQLVCTAGLEIYGPFALLRSVAVDAAARGQGCARQLIAELVQSGRRQGVSQLFLLTTTAAAYFTPLGFRTISRRAVPAAIRQSREFQGACPDSAVAMVRRLDV